MNPDLVAAIARLRGDSIRSSRQAALFNRVARGSLVSIRLEIRLLLYVGVLLLTSGVGLLVVEHHRDIGPLVIAGSVTLAAVACLVWVARQAPPFSWDEVPSPSVAFDYVLLLGLLLLALSLVTLRHYVHVAPLWVVLTAAGGLLIAVALAVPSSGHSGGAPAVSAWASRRRRSSRTSGASSCSRPSRSRPPSRRRRRCLGQVLTHRAPPPRDATGPDARRSGQDRGLSWLTCAPHVHRFVTCRR